MEKTNGPQKPRARETMETSPRSFGDSRRGKCNKTHLEHAFRASEVGTRREAGGREQLLSLQDC
jgi:hypothetical protein